MAKKIRIPDINELDLSRIRCDAEIGRFGVQELLKGLSQIPEEHIRAVIRQNNENREGFANRVASTLMHDATIMAFEGGTKAIYDLTGTARAVVDIVLDAVAAQLED